MYESLTDYRLKVNTLISYYIVMISEYSSTYSVMFQETETLRPNVHLSLTTSVASVDQPPLYFPVPDTRTTPWAPAVGKCHCLAIR